MNAELERDVRRVAPAPHRRQHRRGRDGHGGASRHGRRGQRRGAARAGGRTGRHPDRRVHACASHGARSRPSRSRDWSSRGKRSRCPRTVCSPSSRGRPPSSGGSTLRSSGGARSSPGCVRHSTKRCPPEAAGSSPSSGRRGSASRGSRARSATLAGDAAVLTGAVPAVRRGHHVLAPRCEIFREAGAEDELEAALSVDAPEEVSWSVRKALEQRARERPLALVMEDIHWARTDPPRPRSSTSATGRGTLRCCSCASPRPELLDERPALGEEQVMTLEPLSELEAEELIGNLRRRRPPRRRDARADPRGRGREPAVRRTVACDARPRAATRVTCRRPSRRCSRRGSTPCRTRSATCSSGRP